MAGPNDPRDRRTFFSLLAIGLASIVAGCTQPSGEQKPSQPGGAPPNWDVPTPPVGAGPNRVLTRAPAPTRQIALTVDDGYSNEVVAGYLDFAVRTAIHLTFSPNGLYAHAWEPHATQIRTLAERGQVQLINHTFTHSDLRKLGDAQIRGELERNDEWINRAFGTGSRPYYRPPFGFHNEHIDGIARDLGYRNTVMWSGSFGDSKLVTPEYLLDQARRYLQPGVIMLGHANHPTVLGLFQDITDLIRQRRMTPVTLNEMFGRTQ